MKLMVGRRAHQAGFALPTVLLVSIAMITILVSAIAAVAASRVSLDSQYYNKLAQQAIESGMARANECLKGSGFTPQWGINAENRDLRPNSDCTGATLSGSWVSAYVLEDIGGTNANLRTKYSIDSPSGTGIGSSLRVIGTTELVRTSNTDSVWRSYTQVAHMQIEPPETVACPEGFIPVPGDDRFGTNDFCVGKYEAKNVGGKAVSRAEGEPWGGINQTDAMAAANDACGGCALISDAQWLTIAHNVANVSSNWSGGSVGDGYIFRGHTDNTPASRLEAGGDDDGYFGTLNTSGDQRRTLQLSNGEVIWDLAGNVREWTDGQISGGQPGGVGFAWREWSDISGTLSPNPFPAFATPAASSWTAGGQGIGRVHTDSSDTTLRAVTRGGAYNNGSDAGIFTFTANNVPAGAAASQTGFRLVFNPLSSIECPTGHIHVPGNSQFGTKDFCVGKYEAKNNGGTAVSGAANAPWTSISQTDAIAAASGACGSCRLISEAEWLTIAHNVLNVSSNWSGGSVGSGHMYIGHSDGSPASALEASDDDDNGYFHTGSASGNQRRTLTLSNGEIIWDLAGNAWEWTSGQVSGGQPGGSTLEWREWNAVEGTGTLSPSPFPSFGTPEASEWVGGNGIGQLYSSSSESGLRAMRRGGGRANTSYGGVLSLSFGSAPSSVSSDIGFRITSDPVEDSREDDAIVQDDLRVLKSLMSSYNSVNGRYHPSASGILQTTDVYGFRASKDSYATNPQATSNLVMCRNTGDGSVYAVVAMSKSGSRFYITESQGVTPYTGAWTGSDLAQGELCGPLGYSSNYRGYALDDTSYLWRKWVDG